jgi:hypothetical protein
MLPRPAPRPVMLCVDVLGFRIGLELAHQRQQANLCEARAPKVSGLQPSDLTQDAEFDAPRLLLYELVGFSDTVG